MHVHMHQDRGIQIVSRVLVVCSMCLSGYFGWVLGEGIFPLNIVLALMCASVAYGVSLMFERAAGYNVAGLRANAVICWIIGSLFLFANCIFDYSSAAAVRDAVATAVTNANNKASDVRGNIDLLRKNITDARASTAWQAALLPIDSYEAEIRNLSGDQTVMKRSNNCADQTRDDTRAHCRKISEAKANLAMAQQKAVYAKQIEAWEKELGGLTSKAEMADFASNPAVAQVKAVVSWVVGKRDLSEANIFWGQNAIMLLMTVLVNAGLAFLGNEIGTMKGLSFAHAMPDAMRAMQAQPHRLTYQPSADREADADRYPHERGGGSSETVIIAPGGASYAPSRDVDPATDELLRRSQDASAKVRQMLAEMKAVGNA